MTVPSGAVLRASARFQNSQGSDVVNVFYFRTTFASPLDEGAVFTAVDDYLSATYEVFDTHFGTGGLAVDLKVDVVEWQNGKWEVTQNVGLQGWFSSASFDANADSLPPGSAVLVKLFTGIGKHIGKKFLGMMTEAANSPGGVVASAVITAVANGFALLLDPLIIGVGFSLNTVIVDHVTGVVRDVIEIAVSDNWAYQRRRRLGTGS